MHDQRKTSYAETLDFVPTPPWATRAFLATGVVNLRGRTVLEPCVGRGHMAEVLTEAGAHVAAADIRDYGYPGTEVVDYLARPPRPVEWVVTNPPFALANEFFQKAYEEAECGVVFHIRTTWLTGVGRWNDIFSKGLLTTVVMHAKNVSATQNRVIRRGSNQFNHSWLVFDKRVPPSPDARFTMIPAAAQDQHERPDDYTDGETTQC